MNLNFNFKEWVEKKPRVLLVSFLLAIIVWSVVTLSVNRVATRTIDGIEVELPSFGASYQALGLDIIDSGQRYTCSVTVSGDRTVIGALTAQSISVTPDVSAVVQAGTYSLTLEGTKTNALLDFSIESVNPHTLTLTFGEVESRKYTIQPMVNGLNVADGYVLQNIICSPKTVTVIGESSELDKISKVTAEVESVRTVSESFTAVASVNFYDEEGNRLPRDRFKIDADRADLTVPIYKEGQVPLTVGFVNVPEGFDTSLLKYTLEPGSIRIAGTADAVAGVTEKVVGYIDLADLKPDVIYQFPVQLSSGFVNLDRIESVAVSMDFTGFDSRKLSVSDIRVENLPAGYRIKVKDKSISNVTVIGLEDEVAKLLPASVVAVIDASSITMRSGSYSVPVSFRIPVSAGCWVAGSYTAVIEVSNG